MIGNMARQRRKIPPSTQLLLDFLRGSARASWEVPELATALDFHEDTVQKNLRHLIKIGLAKKQRRGRYFLYALMDRPVPAPPMADDSRAILGLLRRKSARTGTCTLTHSEIAKEIGRSWPTVYKYIRDLKTRGLITGTRGWPANTYTVAGLAAAVPSEPPILSVQGKLLKFLRRKCAKTGTFSCEQGTIAKAIGHTKNTVYLNIKKLQSTGLITASGRRPSTYRISAPSDTRPQRTKATKRAGRRPGSISKANEKIIKRWEEMGCPDLTPQVLDRLAKEFYGREFSRAIPGTKAHKRIRDRVRSVIVRYRASLGGKNRNFRSATKMISAATK